MGVSCCYYNEKEKEEEVIYPKIKYNIFEINKMITNYPNTDNIMTNTNKQDIISSSSYGYGLEKKYDSIDSPSKVTNKFQKNDTATKVPYLEQIKEKDHKNVQEQEENSKNEGFYQTDIIDVNNLISDVDKIFNDNTDNNNNKNKNLSELRRMNQIKFESNKDEDYNKSNKYNIDEENIMKIKGDNNISNNFNNFDDVLQDENKNEELNKNMEISNQSIDNIKKENSEIFQVEINELINSENQNNKINNKSTNINLSNNSVNENNKKSDINDNNNYEKNSLKEDDKNKNSNDILQNLDDLPLIDEDENINNDINSNKEKKSSISNYESPNSEIEKKESFDNNQNKSLSKNMMDNNEPNFSGSEKNDF